MRGRGSRKSDSDIDIDIDQILCIDVPDAATKSSGAAASYAEGKRERGIREVSGIGGKRGQEEEEGADKERKEYLGSSSSNSSLSEEANARPGSIKNRHQQQDQQQQQQPPPYRKRPQSSPYDLPPVCFPTYIKNQRPHHQQQQQQQQQQPASSSSSPSSPSSPTAAGDNEGKPAVAVPLVKKIIIPAKCKMPNFLEREIIRKQDLAKLRKLQLLQKAEALMHAIDVEAGIIQDEPSPPRARLVSSLKTLPPKEAKQVEKRALETITRIRTKISGGAIEYVNKSLSHSEKILLESPFALPLVEQMKRANDKAAESNLIEKMKRMKEKLEDRKSKQTYLNNEF